MPTADTVIDTTPATVNVTSAGTGAQSLGDAYGTSSIAFSTPYIKVIPPRAGLVARIYGFKYDCGGTVHTATGMVVLDNTFVSTDAASGQAVLKVKSIPTALDGSALAANDIIVVKDENGTFRAYQVASVSGLSITITVSVGDADGSGFTVKIPKENTVWFFGAPGDHASRQITLKASTREVYENAIVGLATAPAPAQPLVLHVNNITATGFIVHGPHFGYVAP